MRSVSHPVRNKHDQAEERGGDHAAKDRAVGIHLPFAQNIDQADKAKTSGEDGVSHFRLKFYAERGCDEDDSAPSASFQRDG
jgi:hypothetical protein